MATAVKVFRKTAPNGKLTVYISRRDFIDNTVSTEPVDGVVCFDADYLKGRKVFATVAVIYRFGREEDEIMGVSMSKEMQLTSEQIYPYSERGLLANEVQERLVRKLGANAHPFAVSLPSVAPSSVILQSNATARPLGVMYELKVFVADYADEKLHKRNSVTLAVRKVQFAPLDVSGRQPTTLVSKGFTMGPGKLSLEVTLDKETFYHNEQVAAKILVTNCSRKTVKMIRCSIIQHVEITTTNNHFTKRVASKESKEGCPVSPGSSFQTHCALTPTAATNKHVFGIALDGKVKDADAHLASSTLLSRGQSAEDALGIVVSYSVRVSLVLSGLGAPLTADLPFRLAHPAPRTPPLLPRPSQDNMVFEEFSKIRRGMSVDFQ